MIWTREQAKALTDRALSFSKAEETLVAVNGGERAQPALRAQHGDDLRRLVRVQPGDHRELRQALGTVTTAQFDDASLQRALRQRRGDREGCRRRTRKRCRSLGPQTYAPVKAYFDDAAAASPEWRAVVGGDRDRAEQEEGRRLGGLRRDAGGDAGGRELEGAVRLRPLTPPPTTT